MTREEAFVYLQIDDADDAEDGFDTALFETKRFLLSKPVFLKTFLGRIAKLEKQYDAFVFLGGETREPAEVPPPDFDASDDLMEHFSRYHSAKNRIRQQLSGSNDVEALRGATFSLISLERAFAGPFADYTDWTEEEVQIGKEPDSMDVLALLKEQSSKGITTLAQLHETKNNLPGELLLVLKRLSLLKNYLYE
jgi:hypothetical protein